MKIIINILLLFILINISYSEDNINNNNNTNNEIISLLNINELRHLLNISTHFYGAQRCGNENNWILKLQYNDTRCHTSDGDKIGIDLTGGFHDAGDNIKFGITTAYATYVLLKAYSVFPQSFQVNINSDINNNNIPDILDEIKVGTDWLIKLRINSTHYVSRVGGDEDHTVFYTSIYQTTRPESEGGGIRPVYYQGDLNAGADITGMITAALSLMSRVYKTYDENYSIKCLNYAKLAYEHALTHQNVTAQVNQSFYQDRTFNDSLMCGATELYISTKSNYYLNLAQYYDDEVGSHDWVLDWSTPIDLCRHSLFMETRDKLTRKRWKRDIDRYLYTISTNDKIRGQAFFGDWGSNRYASNAAFSVALFYMANERNQRKPQYKKFVYDQLNFLVGGKNPYNRSFVIGFGKNYPRRPHHGNSFGKNYLPSDGINDSHLHLLYGGLVGGPTRTAMLVSEAGYVDDTLDWISNEVSISYNAGLVGFVSFSFFDLMNPTSEWNFTYKKIPIRPDLKQSNINTIIIAITSSFGGIILVILLIHIIRKKYISYTLQQQDEDNEQMMSVTLNHSKL